MTTSIDIAREAAMAADDKKASDVVVLDVRGISDVVDAIVVCTAANSRLAGAVVDEVEERLRLRFGLPWLAPSINPGRSAMAKLSPDFVRTIPKLGTIVVKW